MNEPQLPPSDALNEQSSPGEMLRHGRQTLELSREEVAAALNLRPAVIQGLEDDRYDEVPVAIYRRGYLRSYASLLGLDPEPVIAAYRARNADEASESPTQPLHLHKPPSRIGAWLFRLVTLAVIIGLAGLTLMWWQSRGGNQPPDPGASEPVSVDSRNGTITIGDAASPGEAPADSGTSELSPATPMPETPMPETGQAVTAPAERAVEAEPAFAAGASGETADGDDGATAVAQDADQESASDAGDAAAATQTGANRLHLVFNEQSWTEIIDANGNRVLVGLQQPGTEATVEGEPPLRMTIGNATGVEMTWRGETENVGGRAGANNVARFTLGE